MHYLLLNEKLHIITIKGPFLKFYVAKWYQNFAYLKCTDLLTDEMCKKAIFFLVYICVCMFQDREKAELMV